MRKLIAGIIFATAIAPTILAAAEPRHPYLPPEEYDRPYTGELKIIRHNTAAEVQAACPSVPNPMACARVFSATKCEVHLLPDYMYVRYGPDIIMRHEIGHCNGWVHATNSRRTKACGRDYSAERRSRQTRRTLVAYHRDDLQAMPARKKR